MANRWRGTWAGGPLLLLLIGSPFFCLTAVEAPLITISADSPVNVLVGAKISIPITQSGASSDHVIIWTKSSVVLVSFLNGTFQHISETYINRLTIDPSGSINISSAMLSDAGNYTVFMYMLDESTGKKEVQVNVYERIGSVSLSSTPAEVKEGVPSVTLNCIAAPGTETNVKWTKDGRDLIVDTRYLVSGMTLMITQPSRADSGLFTCNISNPFSNGSASFNLTIYYGPEIPGITIASDRDPYTQGYVQVNSNVNLTCSAESNPPAQYSWTVSNSSDTNVPSGPILSLPNIKLAQAGPYNCLAENSKTGGKVRRLLNLAVYEFPQGGPICTVEAINSNSALRFLCSWPTGSPRPTLTFYGLPGSASSTSPLEQNVTAMGGLSGTVITCAGVYQVPSLNGKCTITPEAPAVLGFTMQASADVGGTVAVDLLFRGRFNPGAVEWFGPAAQQLSSGGRYNVSEGSTRLTVSNFTLEGDLGNYSYRCRNPLGEKSQALNLTAPSVSSCTATRSSDGQSATIAWTVPLGAVITSLQVQMLGTPLTRAATVDWQTIQSIGSANGSYVVSGLQPSESYSFRVAPMFGSRQGTPSDAQTVNPTHLTTGAIIGIAVGSALGALLIILLLVLLICCIRKRKGQKGRPPPAPKPSLKKTAPKNRSDAAALDGEDPMGKVVWRRSSVSSSTITDGPPLYNTHNAMFRSTSVSTISAASPSNGTVPNNMYSTWYGANKPKVIRASTQV